MIKSKKILIAVLFALPMFANSQEKKTEKIIPNYSTTDRKDIPREFTWNVDDIYATYEYFKADLNAEKNLINKLDQLSKDWTASAQKMLALLDLNNEINLKADKLYSYAERQSDVDIGNQYFQTMKGELQSIFVNYRSKMSFFNPDIIALGSEKFNLYLKAEPKLEPYRFTINDILRIKDHNLPKDKQEIYSLTGLFSNVPGSASGMLNNLEIPGAEVTLSDGQKVILNNSNYMRYRNSKNASDRSLVVTTYWKNMKKFENTFSILLNGGIKQDFFNAKVHNFNSCLSSALFYDNIDTTVYYQLIKSVRSNLTPLHRYIALKKKLLKLDKFRYDDIYTSAVPSVDKKYTYDDAKKIIVDVMKVMGDDYTNVLKRAFDNRWIDVYPNKGKQGGAYCSGLYGVHPYVKANYIGDYADVSMLIHELGHAMHSYFSESTQPYANSQYAIFLAEIASTFNQNMLIEYLLKTETDDLFKLFLLDNYLDQARGTLYRQTLFSEFVLAMHRRVEEGQSLTSDWLDNKYLDLTKKYYGDSLGVCEVGDFIQNEWSGIPHFYRGFYVYQYSTGIIASLALTDMVTKDGDKGRDRYLELLKAGSSDYPLNILKKAGVDMTTPAPYEAAMKRFDDLVMEMEKIYERLKQQGKL
ncbi:MAG: oligoendopeptidase F [Bacteroidales bacterium]|nr:oligoendopeptidase F [Bacteroidales bacterium]